MGEMQGMGRAVCFTRQLLFVPVRMAEKFPALIGGHRSFQSMMKQIMGEEYVKGRKRTDQLEKAFVGAYARSWCLTLEAFLCRARGCVAKEVHAAELCCFCQ